MTISTIIEHSCISRRTNGRRLWLRSQSMNVVVVVVVFALVAVVLWLVVHPRIEWWTLRAQQTAGLYLRCAQLYSFLTNP